MINKNQEIWNQLMYKIWYEVGECIDWKPFCSINHQVFDINFMKKTLLHEIYDEIDQRKNI